MKKKLEAELISIAHRILKLKNTAELIQLQKEAQLLHEKLSVLVFVEEHFAGAKPTIGKAKADKIIEDAFEAEPAVEETVEEPIEATTAAIDEPIAEPVAEAASEDKPGDDEEEGQNEEQVEEPEQPEEEKLEREAEPIATPIEKEVDEVIAKAEEEVASASEEITDKEEQSDETDIPAEENVETPAAKEEDIFKPTFEWAFDTKSEEDGPEAESETKAEEPAASGQIAFEDLLGAGYVDPVFVKPEDSEKAAAESYEAPIPRTNETPEIKPNVISISRYDDKVPVFKMNSENATINDRMSKGITVGLNDRIAFVKNLFNNSNEEYNRVLSQLLTYDTIEEAQDFIDNMVKPDYNNWEGKDEYAQRFMEVIEKKFS